MSLFRFFNFSKQNEYIGKKTFSYFIPAPPSRKTGYQEKEFDHIIGYLTSKGFEILDIKMQSLNTELSSGMWVICILGMRNTNLLNEDIDLEYSTIASLREQTIKLDPSIEHEC